jgi:regulator of protease activity HflC (stomatin/prohibitin superfamily)
MSKAIAIVVGLLMLTLLLLFSMTYTVRFHEVAVKTRYGRTSDQSVVTKPGPHFRLPLFADRVTKFDTRVRLVETPLVETSTADAQSVVVRAFLMWKVDPSGALDFYRSYESVEDADGKLKDQMHTVLKSSLGRYRFDDLVGPESRLPEAEDGILREFQTLASVGVAPLAVATSQVLLPTKTTTAVLERMEATRKQLAETERARGGAEAQGIQAQARTLADKYNAFTDQWAQDIRKEAALQSAELLKQMTADEDLAIFLMHADLLEQLAATESTFFFSESTSPGYLLDFNALRSASGIPRPPGASVAERGSPTASARPDDEEEEGGQ